MEVRKASFASSVQFFNNFPLLRDGMVLAMNPKQFDSSLKKRLRKHNTAKDKKNSDESASESCNGVDTDNNPCSESAVDSLNSNVVNHQKSLCDPLNGIHHSGTCPRIIPLNGCVNNIDLSEYPMEVTELGPKPNAATNQNDESNPCNFSIVSATSVASDADCAVSLPSNISVLSDDNCVLEKMNDLVISDVKNASSVDEAVDLDKKVRDVSASDDSSNKNSCSVNNVGMSVESKVRSNKEEQESVRIINDDTGISSEYSSADNDRDSDDNRFSDDSLTAKRGSVANANIYEDLGDDPVFADSTGPPQTVDAELNYSSGNQTLVSVEDVSRNEISIDQGVMSMDHSDPRLNPNQMYGDYCDQYVDNGYVQYPMPYVYTQPYAVPSPAYPLLDCNNQPLMYTPEGYISAPYMDQRFVDPMYYGQFYQNCYVPSNELYYQPGEQVPYSLQDAYYVPQIPVSHVPVGSTNSGTYVEQHNSVPRNMAGEMPQNANYNGCRSKNLGKENCHGENNRNFPNNTMSIAKSKSTGRMNVSRNSSEYTGRSKPREYVKYNRSNSLADYVNVQRGKPKNSKPLSSKPRPDDSSDVKQSPSFNGRDYARRSSNKSDTINSDSVFEDHTRLDVSVDVKDVNEFPSLSNKKSRKRSKQ